MSSHGSAMLKNNQASNVYLIPTIDTGVNSRIPQKASGTSGGYNSNAIQVKRIFQDSYLFSSP
jgi:hypothetical protein